MTNDPHATELKELALALERELGVPAQFLAGLPDQGDWAFVMLTHALAETSVMHTVGAGLGNAAVADVVTSLALSDARSGKLAILRALGHGEKAFVRFVDHLSRLRNLLIHGFAHAAFDLRKHVAGLSEAHFRDFVDAFGTTAEFPRSVRSTVRTRQEQLVRQAPKDAMFRLTCFWLAHVHLGAQHALFRSIETHLERVDHGRGAP